MENIRVTELEIETRELKSRENPRQMSKHRFFAFLTWGQVLNPIFDTTKFKFQYVPLNS